MNTPKVTSAVSRRNFMRMAGVAATLPVFTEAHFAYAALQTAAPATKPAKPAGRRFRPMPPPGAVLINANENPLGPSKAACEAIAAIAHKGGRYDIDGETEKLTKTFAAQNGLKEEYVSVYAGSSEPLQYTVMAFTSPTKPFITADPSYEAGMRAAQDAGAKVIKVPLNAEYAHDVKAMVAAHPNAGVLYICNPNNPTGTLTKKEDIVWALANKPKGSILLVDEAYIHLSDGQNVLDQVAADKDLIVLRTFSKVYGMAGIRCGFAVGRPDLLAKLQEFGQNPMPITGSAAANVSLLEPTLVPERKAIIAGIRNDTFAFLEKNNYKFIPSQSNCFMIDTGRPGRQVISAMQAKNVFIGRTWPIWPNYVRVTVGSADDMAKFKVAFKEVMDAPAMAEVHVPPHVDFDGIVLPQLA
jgi:histidinol-phosphate aminotransferase